MQIFFLFNRNEKPLKDVITVLSINFYVNDMPLSKQQKFLQAASIQEDTHKKSVIFSGRTTKGVGRGNPPTTKQKTIFFYKWRKFTEKLHNENIIL